VPWTLINNSFNNRQGIKDVNFVLYSVQLAALICSENSSKCVSFGPIIFQFERE